MPYSPASSYATNVATQMSTTGSTALCIPTASPAMMFVAAPVRDASAMRCTGREAV